MARTLVVGGCGFLGSHVVDALLAEGHEVRVIDIRPVPLELVPSWGEVAYRRGDMLDAGLLAEVTKGCDYAFQYATTTIPKTSIADPELDNQNLIATLRLIRACVGSKVAKIVFPSSGGTVYGKPDRLPISEDAPLRPGSPYAATKIAIEQHLAAAHRVHGLDYTVLRYGNPYGPRQSPSGNMGIVSIFLGLLRRGERPTLFGNGDTVKDFFYVDDAASAAVAVLPSSEHKVFNVASGRGTTVRELIDAMAAVVGRPIEPKRAPALAGDEPACVLDTRRIREAYSWRSKVDLVDGLRRTWAWIQSLPDF